MHLHAIDVCITMQAHYYDKRVGVEIYLLCMLNHYAAYREIRTFDERCNWQCAVV